MKNEKQTLCYLSKSSNKTATESGHAESTSISSFSGRRQIYHSINRKVKTLREKTEEL